MYHISKNSIIYFSLSLGIVIIATFSVDEWARPIFGVASDMKSLSRDKREERDYANLSQAARRRLSSSGERRTSQDEEYQ